jgi:hypothetical protein
MLRRFLGLLAAMNSRVLRSASHLPVSGYSSARRFEDSDVKNSLHQPRVQQQAFDTMTTPSATRISRLAVDIKIAAPNGNFRLRCGAVMSAAKDASKIQSKLVR